MNYLVFFNNSHGDFSIKLRKPLSPASLKSYQANVGNKTPYLVYWGVGGIDVKEIFYNKAAVRTIKEIPNGDLKAAILNVIEPSVQTGPN